MIAYLTKQYQAVPALMQLYAGVGGVFITTRASTRRAIKRVYPGTRVAMLHESLGRFSAGGRAMRQSSAIITGSPNRELLSRYYAPKYMVFHGTYAYMTRPGTNLLRHFDHICVIGPRMAEMLADSGMQDKLVAAGYLPFLEFPERTPAGREKSLIKIGLDPANRTLLYMPRGKPYGSWDVMAEKLLREVPSEYNLILRPHPSQSVTIRFWDRVGFMHLEGLSRKRGNAMIDLADNPLSTLFSVSDLLLSDGASAPEESLYYDLPQVFIESEGSSRKAIASMLRKQGHEENYIERLLSIYHCGKSITPESRNMEQLLETAMQDSDLYRPYRKAYFNWVFGERGVEKQHRLIDTLKQQFNVQAD
jgi:CDP-glycerol glycerophosphotransferase (TagB/SpsB family)